MITVDHIFPHDSQCVELDNMEDEMDEIASLNIPDDSDNNSENKSIDGSNPSSVGSEDAAEIGALWTDTDAEYLDDYDDDDLHSEDVSVVVVENYESNDLTWERISPPHLLSCREPYLDWSLSKPSNHPISPRPNFYRPPISGGHKVSLHALAAAPRFHGVPVYMVSCIRGVLSGRLLHKVTMIGSGPGRDLCEAWTIMLDSKNRKLHISTNPYIRAVFFP